VPPRNTPWIDHRYIAIAILVEDFNCADGTREGVADYPIFLDFHDPKGQVSFALVFVQFDT
jgi:hypothetical protein